MDLPVDLFADLPDLDFLLEGIQPGLLVVFAALAVSIAVAVLADGIAHAIAWIAAGPERRKAQQIAMMRRVILDWKPDPPTGASP